MKEPTIKKKTLSFNIPEVSSRVVLKNGKAIFVITALCILFSITGAMRLVVENSFINYFKKDTSIYKGMKVIDQELGGTTPLDVILIFKNPTAPKKNIKNSVAAEDEEIDSFEEEFDDEKDAKEYWFTDERISIIKKVHNYLNSLKDIGDVKSFETILETGKILNKGEELDGVEIALIYKKLPQKYRDIILSPYVDLDANMIRFTTRIKDSNEGLRRNELLNRIRSDLSGMLDPNIVTFRLSNLMVIYNNMLQSLFRSQIATFGFVLLILFVMFLILFKSLRLTLIALIVNVIPIGIVFGFMGWLNIPLDIMTITIAAIAMGIGVDDTIHYIHRFKVEFAKEKNYINAMLKTNKSIGMAMYYTSLTVIVGFSILVLSNLIPTIYFGILTMLVMAAALISNLVLLPKLLLVTKPLGEETKNRR
jgi:predicted RND superfamily exporter protein